MVAIRLIRFGHKNAPFYRVVAINSRQKQSGNVLETLGTWNPKKNESKIDKDKVKAWVTKGAKLSPAVQKLLK